MYGPGDLQAVTRRDMLICFPMRRRKQPPAAKPKPRPRGKGSSGRRGVADGQARRSQAALTELQSRHDQLQTENEHLRETVRHLESALNRYADLYDEAPIAYVTIDHLGVIREMNRIASALIGTPRQQIVGMPFTTVLTADERPLFIAHLRECRRGGAVATKLHLERRDRITVPVELLTRRAPGMPASYRMAIIDLTERQEATRERHQLETAEKAAREANEAKDRSIAILGHELRAPLTPMLAAVAALERSADDPAEVLRLSAVIRRNASAEARLIDDLLDVSRLASGKLELRREPTPIDAVAREVLEMFAEELRAKQLWTTVEFEAQSHLVEGDRGRLGQVLANLVGNAIKFTPPGGRISIRSWNRGPVVAIEVSDSGVGIAEDALPRLFTPYQQVHDRKKVPTGGMGLGLAICRGIVELHGGTIAASSRGLDKGARFVVELPTMLSSVDLPSAEVSTAVPLAAGMRAQKATGRPRLLLIEDNVDTAEALSLALGKYGYEVEVAPSAEAALRMDLAPIDLIISDLSLPDVPGRELLQLLREKRLAPLKAIALSGFGSEKDVRASKAAGFLEHLTKPIELEALTSAIDRAINGNRSS
jgi:PAS domain S-box-containing protein